MSEAPPNIAPEPIKGDLTQGPILKTLLAFSLPTLAANILQTLNGTINSIWVGQLLGESALAATANANFLMFLMFSLIYGFGMAATVRVGQFFGGRQLTAMRRTFATGTGFCAILSVLTAAVGYASADSLLSLLGTPPESRGQALAYLQVIFISLPFGTLSMMVSMGIRGTGDSRTPLHAMILMVVVDVALNPLLILGFGPIPPLGIAGSALATALANLAGLGLQIWRIYARDLPLRLRGAELCGLIPGGKELGYIIGKGVPTGAQMMLATGGSLVMIGLVNREGLNSAAAYGASLQLWSYLQMPAFAISSAVSAMAAQNIGANKHHRIQRITCVGVGTSIVATSIPAVLLTVFDRPLLSLFLGAQSAAVPLAEHIQLVSNWSYVPVAMMMILNGTMRAYGAVLVPMVILALSMYAARLGFYALAYPHLGVEALWWAYPIGSIASVLLTAAAFWSGYWRPKLPPMCERSAPAGAPALHRP